MQDILSTLNPEQYAAVTAENKGSLLVLAGAGCGKTAVLTRRIVWLARQGVEPGRICALTFSRKAAEEMARRLVKLDPFCESALVTTFHAFALRVLREKFDGVRNFNRLGFEGEARLLEGAERLKLLAESCNAAQRNALRMGLMWVDSALDLLASSMERASKKWNDTELGILKEIERNFAEARKSRGLWDFSDLLNGCLELFRRYPQIARHISGSYDAVLVDEFQDTNPAQIDMLDALLGPGASLYAVGDDDQAIYGFRGADIGPIMNFAARFKDARLVKLQTNYRSVTPILECANKLWRDKPAEYRKILVSGLKTQPSGCRKPRKKRFGIWEDALDWVLYEAGFLCRRESIPIEETAALFRLNDTLDSAAEYYKSRGIDEFKRPQLLTVHASKGLEYPAVFLCDLEEGMFPHYNLPKEAKITSWAEFAMEVIRPKKVKAIECDMDEELRLFYVGITRARRFLYFVTAEKKPRRGRMAVFKPSRFLRLV